MEVSIIKQVDEKPLLTGTPELADMPDEDLGKVISLFEILIKIDNRIKKEKSNVEQN